MFSFICLFVVDGNSVTEIRLLYCVDRKRKLQDRLQGFGYADGRRGRLVRAAREETKQSWASKVQGGGGNAEEASASQYCAVLQLLGGAGLEKKEHRSRDGADAQRDVENVSIIVTVNCQIVWCDVSAAFIYSGTWDASRKLIRKCWSRGADRFWKVWLSCTRGRRRSFIGIWSATTFLLPARLARWRLGIWGWPHWRTGVSPNL